jgi:hypothetical protein
VFYAFPLTHRFATPLLPGTLGFIQTVAALPPELNPRKDIDQGNPTTFKTAAPEIKTNKNAKSRRYISEFL